MFFYHFLSVKAGTAEAILKCGGGGHGKSLTFPSSTFYLLIRPYPGKFDPLYGFGKFMGGAPPP